MITGIEVSNFKGFRELNLSGLGRYHVLVGPNGSGKSTFFEVLEFIKDLLKVDVQEAVSRRYVNSLRDLTFDRRGGSIRFDISLDPDLFGGSLVHYRLELQESTDWGSTIASEVLVVGAEKAVWRTGNTPVNYVGTDRAEPYFFSFPWERSALAQVPPDEDLFPAANLARKLLSVGVQPLPLNSEMMRRPSFGGPTAELQSNGANLPRVARILLLENKEEWIDHLKLALEDLEDVCWRQQDDRSEYLLLRYRDGLEIPTWLASFGTLRTLALTVPAFLPDEGPKLYLFEEPENGIHPKAIEIVMSAIKSIPNAQTFVTTHSPIVVQDADVDDLLLFSKRGKEVIVQRGTDNPILRDWDGVPDLGTVIASRVLG